jgi:hypothetical protein
MEYIYFSLSDIPELVVPIRISVVEVADNRGSYCGRSKMNGILPDITSNSMMLDVGVCRKKYKRFTFIDVI